jgi:hypothetical protein
MYLDTICNTFRVTESLQLLAQSKDALAEIKQSLNDEAKWAAKAEKLQISKLSVKQINTVINRIT